MLTCISILALTLLLPAAPPSPSSGILGNWREPSGSVIEISACGQAICARLIAISPQAPSKLDTHNPDTAQRSRPLCGLQIGYGFHLTNPSRAEGGKLYDPKSGKTYSGSMTLAGNRLQLRGYIGLSLFGKSQTWTRAASTTPACSR